MLHTILINVAKTFLCTQGVSCSRAKVVYLDRDRVGSMQLVSRTVRLGLEIPASSTSRPCASTWPYTEEVLRNGGIVARVGVETAGGCGGVTICRAPAVALTILGEGCPVFLSKGGRENGDESEKVACGLIHVGYGFWTTGGDIVEGVQRTVSRHVAPYMPFLILKSFSKLMFPACTNRSFHLLLLLKRRSTRQVCSWHAINSRISTEHSGTLAQDRTFPLTPVIHPTSPPRMHPSIPPAPNGSGSNSAQHSSPVRRARVNKSNISITIPCTPAAVY